MAENNTKRTKQDFVELNKLAQMFLNKRITPAVLFRLIEQKKAFDTTVALKSQPDTNVPLLRISYEKGKQSIYILREHIPLFLCFFQEDLKKFGVTNIKINNLSLISEKRQKKTKEMVSFCDFCRYIKLPSQKKVGLLNVIQKEYLNAMYRFTDIAGNEQEEPVFALAYVGSHKDWYFKNEQAVKSFICTYDSLLKRYGVHPLLIEHIKTGEPLPPYDKEKHIFKTSLKKLLGLTAGDNFNLVYQKAQKDRYPSTDEAGNPVLKNMFELVNKEGRTFSVLKREALRFFVRKYQKILKINPLKAAELIRGIVFNNEIVALSVLAALLQTNKNLMPFLGEKIKRDWINDTYAEKDATGRVIKQKPIFILKKKKNGMRSICIDLEGVADFFFKHEKELEKLGINTRLIKEKQKDSLQDMKTFLKTRAKKRLIIYQNLQAHYIGQQITKQYDR